MKSINVPFNGYLYFEEKPNIAIQTYKWEGNGYTPLVEVYLCHNNERLKVKFVAFESEITCKEKNDNGRVWCDSCVEFFVKPFMDDNRYINFEINPNGAMIMSIGESKENRIPHVSMYKNKLNVKTTTQEDCWSAEFEIPFLVLKTIYNKSTLMPIKKLAGNFYKCGDETKFPHFGMWNEIDEDKPDFHSPQYFGELILE